MAIRLRLKDGTDVESDSPDELAKFYQQLSRNGHEKKAPTDRVIASERSGTLQFTPEPLPDKAEKLIQMLLPNPDGIDVSVMAASFNVVPKGIGGYITSFTNWAKRNGIGKKTELLEKKQRFEGSKRIRSFALTKKFRQMIKEGRIPKINLAP